MNKLQENPIAYGEYEYSNFNHEGQELALNSPPPKRNQ